MTDITLAQFMCDFHKDSQEVVVKAKWLQTALTEADMAKYEIGKLKEEINKLKDSLKLKDACIEFLKDSNNRLNLIV